MSKEYRPDLVLPGGRNGDDVTSIRTAPNSFIRGGGNHVFETDREGKVIRDIDPDRVKVRKRHQNGNGQIFEKMEKNGSPTSSDRDILCHMGVKLK